MIIAFIFATFYLCILPNIRKGHHGQQSPPFLMQKFSPSHINKLRINLYIQDISSRNFNLYKHKMLNFYAMLIRKHQTKLETKLINQTCETKLEETNLSDKPNMWNQIWGNSFQPVKPNPLWNADYQNLWNAFQPVKPNPVWNADYQILCEILITPPKFKEQKPNIEKLLGRVLCQYWLRENSQSCS